MRRRILVLHSGGMDSTVCLYAAHRAGYEVISLGIDYGQRLRVEMMFAEKHCATLGVRRDVIQVKVLHRFQRKLRNLTLFSSISEIVRLRGKGCLDRSLFSTSR